MDSTFEPAPHPLPPGFPPAAPLMRYPASTAYSSGFHQSETVAQRQGSENYQTDKDKEHQYLHEAPLLPL